MPPSLVLLNTGQTMIDDPTLARTTFHSDSEYSGVDTMVLYLDEGGHKPSPEESSFAPFYQAASQRVLTIGLRWPYHVFVMKTEVLLRLAQERGGTDLPWGKWKAHTVEVGSLPIWISGPRLFSTNINDECVWLKVCDFSPRVSKMYAITNGDGIVRQVVRPCRREHYLPWNSSSIYYPNGGHESVSLIMVNAPLWSPRSDLNLTLVL